MVLTDIQVGLGAFVIALLAMHLIRKFVSIGQHHRNPPGPWGLPLIGNMLQVGSKPHLSLTDMSKKYGNVFQIYMGSQRTVVISGLETIKEALLEDSTTFAGRLELWSFKYFGEKQFAFTTYDERYKLHRKIARHALYMFTNNKDNPVDEMIQQEAQQMVEDLLSHNGKPLHSKSNLVGTASGSIIYSFLFGNRQQLRKDGKFIEFARAISLGNIRSKITLIADFIPITRPFLKSSVRNIASRSQLLKDIVQEKTTEHLASYKDGLCRDVTDALIVATREHTQEEKELVGLTDEQILQTTRALILAGTGTVTSFLKWAMLYMIKFPEIQRKVQSEIDNAIGKDTQPSFTHRSMLPYTEATTWEILRCAVLMPFLLPHATVNDTVLNGYLIKKDTFVMFNIWSTSRDQSLWASPEKFNPEHFLDESGALAKHRINWILPFGAGKRRCVAEKMGRIELLVFFATLLQKCSLTAAPGQELSLEPTISFGHETSPYTIIITPRRNP